MANSKRPTMLDVAKLSGVSYQTVSRVINNHPYVSDDTREKVQQAIDTLNYRPSKAAINLRAKMSKTIAIILYGSWFNGPVQMALNVEMAAKTSGFDVILNNVTETEQQVEDALEHVRDWGVDGIVMIIPAHGLPMKKIYAICDDIPIVFIDSYPSEGAPSIVLDEAEGTKQIIEHLIGLGHQNFCEISGPQDWYSARIRHRTCLDVLKAHNLPEPTSMESNWTTSGGYQATRRALERSQPFTAIIAANDSMAFGAYRALHEAGLSVPNDVSVVGFDDIEEATYFTPPLTTVRHNFIQLGTVGFESLLQVIDDPDKVIEQKVISSRLIIRSSTAPIQS